jgi:hypothetical protein
MLPPALPLTVVGPVLVIVVPASIAKFDVAPKGTGACAAIAAEGKAITAMSAAESRSGIDRNPWIAFMKLADLSILGARDG